MIRISVLLFLSARALLAQTPASDLDGWHLYRDRESGFQVRYPPSCTEISAEGAMPAAEVDARRRHGTLFYHQEMCARRVTFANPWQPVATVEILRNPEGLPLRDFALRVLTLHGTYVETDISLDTLRVCGQQAIQAHMLNRVGGYTGGISPVLVATDDHVILLQVHNGTGRNPHLRVPDIEEGMLATFSLLGGSRVVISPR